MKAFELADNFVLSVYRETKAWPNDERFGLTSQVRRASVSIASNIVEGCARESEREYLRFLEIAYSSAREVAYQLSLARRLDMPVSTQLESQVDECCRVLYTMHKRGVE